MKPFSISLFIGACALVLVAEGLPRERRFKRQAETTTTLSSSSTSDPSTLSTAASPAASTSSSPSTTTTTTSQNTNQFGIGAAAGIGGVTRGIGLGSFNPNMKSDAFEPWGAFAGLNLGNGGRIGAGCSGLSCGVQLGQLVLATPQLLGIGRNFLNPQDRGRAEAKKSPELTETSETNLQPGANPEDFRHIFRDAFRGFRETLASFFRAPVTHFVRKSDRALQLDNSTESVVGVVKSAASEPKTYRIQLTPARPVGDSEGDKNEQENEVA